MPEQPGSMGKKPQGSFVNTNQLVTDIRKKKELDSLEQMKDKAEESKVDAEEQKQDAKIAELLPKKLDSAYGELPYSTFKEIYKDIFEAVANKDHWSMGYVAHEFNLYDGVPVRVRTMRKREADVLRGVAPRGTAFGTGDLEKFNMERAEYETVRLLLCLQQFGDTTFQDDAKLTLANFETWRKSAAVAARTGMIEDLPDEIIAFLGAVINDTMTAYRCAMTENLKNQLAPLSAIIASA